jgi:glucosylglycerol-phosphate synthase
MILATDLDGTFLAGQTTEKNLLYSMFEEGSDNLLIYVTGRNMETVKPLLTDPLMPKPQYIIGDVGASIFDGSTMLPFHPLQARIATDWPGESAIVEALAGIKGMVRQNVPQTRRCSYFIHDTEAIDDVKAKLKNMACDVIISLNSQYLDVVPQGCSKGNTLLALIEYLGLDRDSIMVAGDTLNDMSLFTIGLKGCVVGKAEEQLLEQTRGIPQVYQAHEPGAGGILSAIEYFGFNINIKKDDEASLTAKLGNSQLLMVYHRMPFQENYAKNELVFSRHSSPNGIIPTLLGLFRQGLTGSWIAWSEQRSRQPKNFAPQTVLDPAEFPNLTLRRIALTKTDINRFYRVFSKEAFWPIIFSFPEKAVFNQELWEHFVEINQLFANATAEEARENAIVWIHDYNLWLVPGFLRKLRPDVTICFFHHTAFPSADIFNVIPWRHEIINSLLHCDYVGFHIPKYVENFVAAVRSHCPVTVLRQTTCTPRFVSYGCALGTDRIPTLIADNFGRKTYLGAHPVGVDVAMIKRIVESAAFHDEVAKIRKELRGLKAILSVERLDYVKGPLEKLYAFEELLKENPDLHGKICLINVCTPPADGMQIYETVQRGVDEAIGRINGKFGGIDWTPVIHVFRSLPFETVLAYYACASICWVTPLRDGLNLVCKEYVATKNSMKDFDAVLVLSEFAGASVEFKNAVLTNPYDRRDLVEKLKKALTMEPQERKMRLLEMALNVEANHVAKWSSSFLKDARGAREMATSTPIHAVLYADS